MSKTPGEESIEEFTKRLESAPSDCSLIQQFKKEIEALDKDSPAMPKTALQEGIALHYFLLGYLKAWGDKK